MGKLIISDKMKNKINVEATELINLGKFKEAIDMFNQFDENDLKKDPMVSSGLAISYAELGDFESAKMYLTILYYNSVGQNYMLETLNLYIQILLSFDEYNEAYEIYSTNKKKNITGIDKLEKLFSKYESNKKSKVKTIKVNKTDDEDFNNLMISLQDLKSNLIDAKKESKNLLDEFLLEDNLIYKSQIICEYIKLYNLGYNDFKIVKIKNNDTIVDLDLSKYNLKDIEDLINKAKKELENKNLEDQVIIKIIESICINFMNLTYPIIKLDEKGLKFLLEMSEMKANILLSNKQEDEILIEDLTEDEYFIFRTLLDVEEFLNLIKEFYKIK